VLVFLLAQEKYHLEQHYSILGEIYHMLAFPPAQAQTHLKHHSIMGESYPMLVLHLLQAQALLEQHHCNVS
jgi:hypothetical protein